MTCKGQPTGNLCWSPQRVTQRVEALPHAGPPSAEVVHPILLRFSPGRVHPPQKSQGKNGHRVSILLSCGHRLHAPRSHRCAEIMRFKSLQSSKSANSEMFRRSSLAVASADRAWRSSPAVNLAAANETIGPEGQHCGEAGHQLNSAADLRRRNVLPAGVHRQP